MLHLFILQIPMAETETNKLHIVLFPWLAFGHLIPFLELGKRIAQKGHKVSFVSTPRNIQRLPKLTPNLNIVELPLPYEENLPENAEATTDVPFDKIPYLKKAYDGLQESMTKFLEASRPDWIIYDFAPYWLPPIAADLSVSRAFFSIFTACGMSFFEQVVSSLEQTSSDLLDGDAPIPNPDPEDSLVHPKWIPFPCNVALRPYEARILIEFAASNYSGIADWFRFRSAVVGCDAFIIRSCEELEADWLNFLEKLHHKPIVPVGLLPPPEQIGEDDKNGTWLKVWEWLNNHDKGSVVYVALGSEVTLSQDELNQLALGLELSGLPFFWALRKQSGLGEHGQIEFPDGFEERTKDRGVIWTTWAPQLRILAHESVGGFLTHCGWSSIIEGLQFGHPLIMLPFVTDQGFIARNMEEKKVGIEIPRDEQDGSFTRNSVSVTLRLVMVDKEGKIHREKAKEMRKIFRNKDLNDRYIDHLVEHLQKHKHTRKV